MTGLPKSRFGQAVCIVLLGIGTGLMGNQIGVGRLPLVPPVVARGGTSGYIPLEEAAARWREGAALFLDAREPADYAAGHIGNALNLPSASFAAHFGTIAPMLEAKSLLVLYCDGTECDLSHRLQGELTQLGFTNSHLLFNGWTAWKNAGLPSSKGTD